MHRSFLNIEFLSYDSCQVLIGMGHGMLSGCRFVAGAQDECSLPSFTVPEIAFAGRSNVGKSSLINALTRNKRNARVSTNPGSTRQINFYLNDGVIALVDLPGYGYSKMSKECKHRYLALVEHYLMARNTLQKVILLIDSRIGLGGMDLDFTNWLEVRGVCYSFVLTKADKLTERELYNTVTFLQEQVRSFCLLLHPIIAVSSKSGVGIKELAHEISKCIGR